MRAFFVLQILLLAATTTVGQFTYPDASAANTFHDGDTVFVAYASTFRSPLLQLFCGNSTRECLRFINSEDVLWLTRVT